MVYSITPSAVAMASAFAFVGWVMGEVNLMLLVVAFLASVGDVSAGSIRAFLTPAERFNRKRLIDGVARKMLAAHLVLLGMVLDWSFRLGVPGAASLFQEHMPWTRFALFILIAAEGSSLLRNVRTVIRVSMAFQRALDALASGGEMQAIKAVDASLAGSPDEIGRRWTDGPRAGATTDPGARGEG
jgi:phage-related holin